MNFHLSFDQMFIIGYDIGVIVCAILIALVAHKIAVAIISRLLRFTTHRFLDTMIRYCAPPFRWIAMAITIYLGMEVGEFPDQLRFFILHILAIILIIVAAWLLSAIVHVGGEWILRRYEVSKPDNLHARRVHTQIKLLERVVMTLIVLVALGCTLMTFDKVRELGVSLLASAGIAGVILGFAAQKVLSGLLAGLQVAITEPIRIEDVVIVEGEWGIIEEITLTYVVIRIWDLRRLVVPMTYFLEKPFQNWTRTSADLLGTVFLYLDPTVDVEPIRAELTRIVQDSPLWDKKVVGLQVTDAKEHTVELRCLVSATNSSAAWDLRCLVREKLLEFIKRTQPLAIPRYRYQDDAPRQSIVQHDPPSAVPAKTR